MTLPKFIITMDGYFRLGMVNQHKHLYNSKREAIELELATHLDEDAVSDISCQFPLPCDYDGEGARGTKFVFYL